MKEAPGGKIIGCYRRSGWSVRQSGITRFELVVRVVLASILATILLERLLRYQEYAERTAMEITVMNMRSGLRLRVAELMMQDRMGEAGNLLNQNPIEWLAMPPPNYRGPLPNSKRISSGNWYFDTERREIVYFPYHDRLFEPGPDGEHAVRLHVTAVRRSQKKADGVVARVEGITLTLVNQYKWR